MAFYNELLNIAGIPFGHIIHAIYIYEKYLYNAGKLALTVFTMQAQDTKKSQQNDAADNIKQLLEAKEFIFKAQSVNPTRGSMRQLTSDYDLRLLGDSLIAFLPYFGRAYTAPINPSNSGIQFTSTQFDYELKEGKKGWDILFRPKDASEVQQLILNVSKSGRAMLRVLSTNRESISFNGYVAARK